MLEFVVFAEMLSFPPLDCKLLATLAVVLLASSFSLQHNFRHTGTFHKYLQRFFFLNLWRGCQPQVILLLNPGVRLSCKREDLWGSFTLTIISLTVFSFFSMSGGSVCVCARISEQNLYPSPVEPEQFSVYGIITLQRCVSQPSHSELFSV